MNIFFGVCSANFPVRLGGQVGVPEQGNYICNLKISPLVMYHIICRPFNLFVAKAHANRISSFCQNLSNSHSLVYILYFKVCFNMLLISTHQKSVL